MKIYQLFEGVRKSFTIGPFEVGMLDHAYDQMKDRKIRELYVDRMLKKLPKLADEINSMDFREGFFIIDNFRKISIGIAKYTDNKLTVITVIDTVTPYARGVEKQFYVG